MLRGLELERLLLAERDGRLVGMIGGWDQHAFRQQVIHGYSGWLRWVRPFYNLASRLRGSSGLPAAGQQLRTLFAARYRSLGTMMRRFSATCWPRCRARSSGGPWSHLLLGLHERDPLLAVARRFQTACYTSLLFLVCWPDGDAARLALDARPDYLELGSL